MGGGGGGRGQVGDSRWWDWGTGEGDRWVGQGDGGTEGQVLHYLH